VSSAASRLSLASLAVAAVLLSVLVAGAVAAPPGKDGKVHACYRVKGKPKGALRVVRSAKARCRRGERKLTWTLAGAPGPAGTAGSGQQGQAGADGSVSSSILEEKVSALTTRVQNLESVLQGVTNLELTEAVNAVPVLATLCDQATALTAQTGLLGDAIEGLSLNALLTGLGGVLQIPTLPAALPAFSCT
jgi:hypothetical protein